MIALPHNATEIETDLAPILQSGGDEEPGACVNDVSIKDTLCDMSCNTNL